jgi:AcrR family transcriptional regulator
MCSFCQMVGDDGPVWRGPSVREIQRTRILDAVVAVVAEGGMARASVGRVIARAEVSRHTFYGCFAGLEEAVVAVMDRTLGRVSILASSAFDRERSWRDGLRSALAAVLVFFDSEPELARVCIVETMAGGTVVLEHRERVVVAFRSPVVERIEMQVSRVSPLAAEGVMASVLGIMHTRMVTGEPGAFVELLGPLMGLATAPYLGARGVEREIVQGDDLARAILERRSPEPAHRAEVRVRVPGVLLTTRAHRARLCLLYMADQGRRGLTPSNQQVGECIGVSDRGQIARLLGRLAGLGLLCKRVGGPGRPNAWSLTSVGEQVARVLSPSHSDASH